MEDQVAQALSNAPHVGFVGVAGDLAQRGEPRPTDRIVVVREANDVRRVRADDGAVDVAIYTSKGLEDEPEAAIERLIATAKAAAQNDPNA